MDPFDKAFIKHIRYIGAHCLPPITRIYMSGMSNHRPHAGVSDRDVFCAFGQRAEEVLGAEQTLMIGP